MSRKVLVTGAGGFIGSHLAERLVRDGHQVRAFVRYNGRDDRGSLGDLPVDIQEAIEVERGDLKDPVPSARPSTVRVGFSPSGP